MLAAILDANVLYPMMLRDTLLRVAAVGCFRLYWSAEILDEVERNLVADRRMSGEKAHRLRQAMEAAFPDAMVRSYRRLIPTMQNHPKDRHVAAAAASIGATLIVTSNIRDFRNLPPGLSAVTPDVFLGRLWAENADLVRAAIQRQANAFKDPQLTSDEIVGRLGSVMPEFARLWHETPA